MGRPSGPLDPDGSFAQHYGWKIRTLREAKGWSLSQLAEKVVCSPGHLSKLEHGLKSPDEQLARLLDVALDTDYFTEHWKVAARDRLSPDVRRLYEYEAEANRVRTFASGLIPGLFQVEGYTRTLALASNLPEEADEVVADRLRRQAALDRQKPPKVMAIMEEAALRKLVGGREVMRAQLAHIEECMARPSFTIQVISARTEVHAGMAGTISLMSFDEGPDVAFQDGLGGTGRILQDSAMLGRLEAVYDLIRSAALPVDLTHSLVREVKEAL